MIHRSRLVRVPASALKDLTKLADESASKSSFDGVSESSDSEDYGRGRRRSRRGRGRAGKKSSKPKRKPTDCWNKRCVDTPHHFKDCPYRRQNQKAKHDTATRDADKE